MELSNKNTQAQADFTAELNDVRKEINAKDPENKTMTDLAMLDGIKNSLSTKRKEEVFDTLHFEQADGSINADKAINDLPSHLNEDEYKPALRWATAAEEDYDHHNFVEDKRTDLSIQTASGLIDSLVNDSDSPTASKAALMESLGDYLKENNYEQEFSDNLHKYMGFDKSDGFDDAKEKFGAQISDGDNVAYGLMYTDRLTDFAAKAYEDNANLTDEKINELKNSDLAAGPTDLDSVKLDFGGIEDETKETKL